MLNRIATVVLIAIFGNVTSALAQLPNPFLQSVFPPSGQVGTEVQVAIAGRDLDDATQLVFSHPGIVAAAVVAPPGEFETEPTVQAGQFRVTIPTNITPGKYEVRAVGRFGASTPVPFIVSTDPQMLESGSNHAPESAIELPLNATIIGHADAAAIDLYQVELQAGRPYVIDCQTVSLDSPLKPVVTVWSLDGRQLLRSRTPAESILDFSPPTDGKYRIGVQDHVFAGGSNFAYRLRVHAGPYVAFVVPSAVAAGATQNVTVVGRNLPGGQPSIWSLNGPPLEQVVVPLFAPDEPPGGLAYADPARGFDYRLPTPNGSSNSTRIGLARHPLIVEAEENNLPSQAQEVTIPCEYSGQFYPRQDQDWVQFAGKQGQQYAVRVISHRAGQQTDTELFVQQVLAKEGDGNQPQVKQISTQDDTNFDQEKFRRRLPLALDASHRDPEITFTADADAIYRIGVRDLFSANRDDPRQHYRLVIEPLRPDFQLTAWTQRQAFDNANKIEAASLSLRSGGVAVMHVEAVRLGGFTGAIELQATGIPPGVTVQPCVIGESSNDGVLVLSADETAADWLGEIKVIGQAVIAGEATRRVASAVSLLGETGNVQQARPGWSTSEQLTLSVVADDPAPVSVQLGPGAPLETCRGAKVPITVTYRRTGEVTGDLALTAIGLPDDIKPGDVTLKPDSNEATVEWHLQKPDFPLGPRTIFYHGNVKLNYARNPAVVARLEQQLSAFGESITAWQQERSNLASAVDASKKEVEALAAAVTQLEAVEQEVVSNIEAAVAAAQKADERLAAIATSADPPVNLGLSDLVATARQSASQAIDSLTKTRQSLGDVQAVLNKSRENLVASQQKSQEVAQAHQQLDQKLQRADEYQKALAAKLEEAKKNNAAKEVTVVVDSSPLTIHVVKSPLQVQITPVKIGLNGDAPLVFDLTRRFGFAGDVKCELKLPEGVKGVSAEPVTLAADQSGGSLPLKCAPDATVGSHAGQLHVSMMFNGVSIEDDLPVLIEVVAGSES